MPTQAEMGAVLRETIPSLISKTLASSASARVLEAQLGDIMEAMENSLRLRDSARLSQNPLSPTPNRDDERG